MASRRTRLNGSGQTEGTSTAVERAYNGSSLDGLSDATVLNPGSSGRGGPFPTLTSTALGTRARNCRIASITQGGPFPAERLPTARRTGGSGAKRYGSAICRMGPGGGDARYEQGTIH